MLRWRAAAIVGRLLRNLPLWLLRTSAAAQHVHQAHANTPSNCGVLPYLATYCSWLLANVFRPQQRGDWYLALGQLERSRPLLDRRDRERAHHLKLE